MYDVATSAGSTASNAARAVLTVNGRATTNDASTAACHVKVSCGAGSPAAVSALPSTPFLPMISSR